jgi:hypothetical protein
VIPEQWRQGGRKVACYEKLLFTNVTEQFLKRYLFTTGKNNCSCSMDFAEYWACAVNFSKEVAPLPFQSILVQENPKWQYIAEKPTSS